MSNILLVEDDVFLRDGLKEMLKKEDYAVEVAPCITEARAALAAKAYNLLILDVMLPDGVGFSFCAEVRTSGNNIPICS